MFGLNIDCLVMSLDGLVKLFKFVVSSAQISMIGCNFGVDIDGLGGQSNFFFKVALFAQSLALQVQEITGFVLVAQVKPFIANFGQFFPPFEVQIGVGEEKILLFGAGHSKCEFQHLLVLFLGFELFDFLCCFLVGLEHHGTTVLEIVKFHLHPYNQSINKISFNSQK